MSIFIAREAAGGQIVNSSGGAFNSYDTVVRNDANWTFDGTRLTLPAGYYLVMNQEGFDGSAVGAGSFATLESTLYINTGMVVACKGTTRVQRLNGGLKCALSTCGVISPGAEGYIRTNTRRLDPYTTNVTRDANSSALQVIQLTAGLKYFRCTSTMTTFTNGGSWVAVPFDNVTDLSADTYQVPASPNTQVNVLSAGTYLVFGHARFYNTSSLNYRTGAARLWDLTNSAEVIGSRSTALTYSTGANYASASFAYLVRVAAPGSYQLQVRNDSATLSGTNLRLNETFFGIMKLPDSTPLVMLRNSTAQDAEAAQSLVHDTQVAITSPFSHVSGQAGITVDQATAYLLASSWYTERPDNGNTEIHMPSAALQIDGTSLGYGHTSNITTGAYSSNKTVRCGATMAAIAPLTAGRVISLYGNPLAGTSDDNFQPEQTVLSAVPLYGIANGLNPPASGGPGRRQVIML